jgi:hypothetical protein
MKTLNQIIKERKAKSNKKRRYKALPPEVEANFMRYMKALDELGASASEYDWPSHAQLDESSRRMKELVKEFMASMQKLKEEKQAPQKPVAKKSK